MLPGGTQVMLVCVSPAQHYSSNTYCTELGMCHTIHSYSCIMYSCFFGHTPAIILTCMFMLSCMQKNWNKGVLSINASSLLMLVSLILFWFYLQFWLESVKLINWYSFVIWSWGNVHFYNNHWFLITQAHPPDFFWGSEVGYLYILGGWWTHWCAH